MSLIKNLRSFRIYGIAVFDCVVSWVVLVALFLWKRKKNLSVWKYILAAIVVMFPIAIATHIVFGVNTMLNYRLGLSDKPSR
jgi:hypothetical protein